MDVCVCRGAGRPVDMATAFHAKASLLRTQRWQNETARAGKYLASQVWGWACVGHGMSCTIYEAV